MFSQCRYLFLQSYRVSDEKWQLLHKILIQANDLLPPQLSYIIEQGMNFWSIPVNARGAMDTADCSEFSSCEATNGYAIMPLL